MKSKLLIILALSIQMYTAKAQDVQKLFFELDLQSKFSFINQTFSVYEFDNYSINLPYINKFRNPVYGMELSVNYKLKKAFSAGVGAGLMVSKYDFHPVLSNEYIDKVLIPIYSKFNYDFTLKNNLQLLTNVKFGYQFADYSYKNTNEGFLIIDKGGFLMGANIGLSKKINNYIPIIKIGYEFYQFAHEYSLNGLGYTDYSYNDIISFSTYYNMVTISLCVRI